MHNASVLPHTRKHYACDKVERTCSIGYIVVTRDTPRALLTAGPWLETWSIRELLRATSARGDISLQDDLEFTVESVAVGSSYLETTMDDNCNLSKCPSVNLSTLDVSDNRDIMKQQATINVHRSMSLQVQRKPDRNNNSNSSNSRSPRSASSHFELGNLLARAASFDAKFLRQLNEYETSERRLSSASNSSDIISSLECNGLGRSSSIVHLPDRYVQATAAATSRRRSGRTNSSTQSAGTVALDPVPEWSATSLNEAPESDSDMWRHRETDAMLAMKWLRHEIVRNLYQTNSSALKNNRHCYLITGVRRLLLLVS